MSQVPRQVPWFDWEEWNYVKLGLYAQPSSSSGRDGERFRIRKAALEVVRMWRARGGSLPHSVDATAHFSELNMIDTAYSLQRVDAILTEEMVMIDGTKSIERQCRSEMELRLMYTMAIVRSINGLADPGQQAIYAESVLSLVSSRGLPGWIVEIRHDGTHNALPTLQVLRSASSILMKWYYDNYWEVQGENIPAPIPFSKNHSNTRSSDNEIINSLQAKKKARKGSYDQEELTSGDACIAKKEKEDALLLSCPLGVMPGHKPQDLYKFILVEEGNK